MTAGFSGFSGSGMRVGHAEREAVAAELREHYASGRLTLEELDERLDTALAAKTRGELDALMTDLPSARPVTAAGTGGGGGQPGPGSPSAGRAIAAMLGLALAICLLVTIGFIGVFGIGIGRPFGILLLLAALAFVRRLFFGRRHVRGRARRCQRRW